jgi:diguanylate cyclase (GGDEF)-like protein
MFLDLDDFKRINDTFGHDAGDAVLKSVGLRLTENMREDDTMCRLGGDEFLYLFTEIESAQDAAGIAEKIAAAISSPCQHGEFVLSVTASIGIALYPRDATTPSELIKCADTAMYTAKKSKSGHALASHTKVSA